MDDLTAERIGRNDAIFREANEGIRESAETYGVSDAVPFLCECAVPTCTEIVRLPLADYEQIRTDPTMFLNAPGHVAAAGSAAEVVRKERGYDVVRTVGRAAEVASELAEQEPVADAPPPTG